MSDIENNNEAEIKSSSVLTKGLQSSLASTPIEDGKLRFTTDTGRLYLDTVEGEAKSRIRISSVEDSYTEEEILALIAPLPKIYIASDTGRAYVSVGDSWIDIGPIILQKAEDGKELFLWMSTDDGDQPNYDIDLSYNTTTKTFKSTNIKATSSIEVGNMIITDTTNEDLSHTINFGFISAE